MKKPQISNSKRKRPLYLYCAGPLTHDKRRVFSYVRAAGIKHVKLMKAGFVPYTPHFAIMADLTRGGLTYNDWMKEDFRWIDRCDALIRMPGESGGADREVEYAKSLGIPVYMWDEFVRKYLDK